MIKGRVKPHVKVRVKTVVLPRPDVCVCIVGDSAVRLWGLSSAERLQRAFKRFSITRFAANGTPPTEGSVVYVRADHLYDERVIQGLVERSQVLLETAERGATTPIGAHVTADLAGAARRWLDGATGPDAVPGTARHTPGTLAVGYLRNLRKVEAPVAVPIDVARRRALERYLFDGAYKGVTDAITKWLWPTPARWAVRGCVRLGIRPNAVTSFSLLLAVLAGYLFWNAHYAPGLVLAWLMTFLDTVDGKLARVTVQSSQFGHYLDHGLDIVHPPLWYVAWGVGLSAVRPPLAPLDLLALFAVIVAAYVVGRGVEGTFSRIIGGFSIFCWRPIDSYFRLVVARRNPNLVLLTAGAAFGRPDWGLIGVAAWTALCSLVLVARLVMAVHARATRGLLTSWLMEAAAPNTPVPRFARPFVRHSAAQHQLVG
jgi:phosphatidylglycerophosphate synthase